ncbi:MAG: hypothetical protein ABI920_10860 [Casimicrobiaceae bacterium]
MPTQPFTLAMYRVRPGQEDAFIAAWDRLAATFSSLPEPPLWGALIRHWSDRTLFYSFGPWEAPEHIKAMRENAQAAAAFAALQPLCETLTPGDFDVVRHVDVRR